MGFYRDKMLELIENTLARPPQNRRHIERPLLVGWHTIDKGQTCLCEPADYVCYHLAHKAEDAKSVRSLWTAPIMRGNSICKRHLSREKARWFFREGPTFERLRPDDLALWKQRIRSEDWDPWEKVLGRRK